MGVHPARREKLRSDTLVAPGPLVAGATHLVRSLLSSLLCDLAAPHIARVAALMLLRRIALRCVSACCRRATRWRRPQRRAHRSTRRRASRRWRLRGGLHGHGRDGTRLRQRPVRRLLPPRRQHIRCRRRCRRRMRRGDRTGGWVGHQNWHIAYHASARGCRCMLCQW